MQLVITELTLSCATVHNSFANKVQFLYHTSPFVLGTEELADLYSSENDQEISSMTSYIFSPFTHLTQMQRMKVERRVQDICSSIPIFGSFMTKCNITRNPCYLVSLIFTCLNLLELIG